jgi:hypothetical protein
MAASEPTFHYHAAGHAFSGEFLRPIRQTIETVASSSLPMIGGHGRSRSENFEIEHIVSVKRAYSHVSGGKGDDGKHHSHSTVVIEGLNILDMVTADRVVARLTSEHDPKQREGHILALGSGFDNLRVAGCPVDVVWDHSLLLDNKNHDALRKGVKKSGRMSDDSNGVILCSLVKSLNADCPGLDVQGHVITVPHFGKIYVGEVVAKAGHKTLSMLRMKLGSPYEGLLSAAHAEINGEPWP